MALLALSNCKEDTPEPVVEDKLGRFDAAFENDFNYIFYDGEARYTSEVDADGYEHISLSLIDDMDPSHWITAELIFHPEVNGIDTATYYFRELPAQPDSPFVAMALRYNNYVFDDHKDLNFGIVYTSHIKFQKVEDGLLKGFIDAHLQCDACPILPYLMSARFEAIPE